MADVIPPLFEDVPSPVPQKPIQNNVEFDASNVNKTISDIQAAGLDVEDGTKREDFSRQEGVFNEFSVAATYFETLKTTIAQSVSGTQAFTSIAVTNRDTTDSASQAATIDTLKNDVSQLIQEGEKLVEKDALLNSRETAFYRDDLETVFRALGIKQDTLAPTTVFRSSEVNVYNLSAQEILTENPEFVQAEIFIAEQQAAQQTEEIAEQISGAVETFSAGG